MNFKLIKSPIHPQAPGMSTPTEQSGNGKDL